ncbi:hypothetical protein [Mangrovactinospora gilvigrisea]|uniref:hypothetical protein n=1 Tax=Mangrovactinospora gilvigrisea TaxID=1428644 RepID=UPI001114B168|nr:hypothetical protein [Mangrovactinospora gilvigrisea]
MAAVGALCVAVGLTGCSSNGAKVSSKDSSTPSASASPSPSPSASEDAKITGALDDYTSSVVTTLHTNSPEGTRLMQVTGGDALTAILEQLAADKRDGVIWQGQPVVTDEQVSSVDMKHRPPQATVRQCFDSRHWYPTLKSTGKRVTLPQQPLKYVVEATMRRSTTGQWVVAERLANRNQSC